MPIELNITHIHFYALVTVFVGLSKAMLEPSITRNYERLLFAFSVAACCQPIFHVAYFLLLAVIIPHLLQACQFDSAMSTVLLNEIPMVLTTHVIYFAQFKSS